MSIVDRVLRGAVYSLAAIAIVLGAFVIFYGIVCFTVTVFGPSLSRVMSLFFDAHLTPEFLWPIESNNIAVCICRALALIGLFYIVGRENEV